MQPDYQYNCQCHAPASPGRRRLLFGAAATAVASTVPFAARSAHAPENFIDMHHHFEPSGRNNSGDAWTIRAAVEELERNSVTAMGWSGPIYDTDVQAGRKKAREFNEWGRRIGVDHPGRFGLFASLPMNDVEGALAEIAYAYDVLEADGIGLASNYGDAWLGDTKFKPIFQELNRRKAVVYVHPFSAPCCTASNLSYLKNPLSSPWMEFPVNTARTILSLWGSRTTQHMPDIKFVFSHGGGVMPMLLGRISGFTGWKEVGPQGLKSLFPDGIYAEFAKLYFECAQAYAPETITMLRSIVPASHLLYGSDYSYFPVSHSVELFGKLDLPDTLRRMIKRENAAALLPRWKA